MLVRVPLRGLVRRSVPRLSGDAGSPYRQFEDYRARANSATAQRPFSFTMPPPPPPPPESGPQLGSAERPIFVASRRSPYASLLYALGTVLFLSWLFRSLNPAGDEADGESKRRRPSSVVSSLLGGNDVEYKPVDTTGISLSDVLGCEEAKEELEEVVDFLKNRHRYEALGGKLPKGLLLVGKPGTGKTMLAKAVATEAEVPFYYASGSEFDEVFVGLGAKRIRELFKQAKKNAPSVVFIDEIDAVGMSRRVSDVGSNSRQTLNQLLSEMDGFGAATGVVVIAATNVERGLDSALTRPGRFDRRVYIAPPDMKGRIAILESYIRKIKASSRVDVKAVAKNTVGLVGADLANIVNIAALHAGRKRKGFVDATDMEFAIDRVSMGMESRRVMKESEKRLTAIHEGGHTLCALFTPNADPVHKVTIVGRGSALGYTRFAAEDDKHSQTVSELRARLIVALGGYVAEEMVFGEHNRTTGAASDLQGAYGIAREMVTRYGFGKTHGAAGVVIDEGQSDELRRRSEMTKEAVDRDSNAFLQEAYVEAKKLLQSRRKELNALADALMEEETLSAAQISHVVKHLNTTGLPKYFLGDGVRQQ